MWRPIALLAFGLATGCNCAGSRGVLVGAGSSASFVKEQGAAVVSSPAEGIVVVSLDGARRRVLSRSA